MQALFPSLQLKPSAILHAAGKGNSPFNASSSSPGAAATALRQGETVEQPKRTNPKQEASKSGAGEGTIDQAA